MPNSSHDDDLLLIRCPSCGQRFKVGDDLRGRTVECGGCEHRFRINDEVIVRGKKFYPGERKNQTLNRFHRVPLAVGQAAAGVDSVQYAEAPDPVDYEPVAPQRILAGAFGVAAMVFIGLLLMFGTGRGGMLDGMITQNRMLMAGFTGVLGIALLIYANPRARRKASGVGLLMTGFLMVLPMVFTEGSKPLEGRSSVAEDSSIEDPVLDGGEPEEVVDESIEALKALIGTAPLEKEILLAKEKGGSKRAVGLWLRDLRLQHRPLIRDYILRVTGAGLDSHYYPRGDGDFLMVVTDIDLLLEEVAELCSVIGTVEQVYPKLSVIEVKVDHERFVEGSIEQLTDQSNPSFYDLNKRELESIELGRVGKAVKRLKDAEPNIYRSDISRKFIALLGVEEVDFKADICTALLVWSEEPGPAGEAALAVAKELHSNREPVPVEIITLIVKEKNAGVLPLLDELWAEHPNEWESLYAELGIAAEATLIGRFADANGAEEYSIVRLLGTVGGRDSLPVLQAALPEANSELKVMLNTAIQAINGRLGESPDE